MSARGERGFTLAELLVALTLLGLLSILVMGGLRFGSRSWERTLAASEGLNATVAAQDFLRARLGGTDRSASVEGDDGRLTFDAVWMTALGAGGVYRFELSRKSAPGEDDDDTGAMILSWRPAPAEDGAEPEADPDLSGRRAIVDGVAALDVAFYGASPDDREPTWRGDWARDWGPPDLVRISVSFDDPRRDWPSLVVALAARG